MSTTTRTRITKTRITKALTTTIVAGALLIGLAAPAHAGRYTPNMANLTSASAPRMQQGLSCGSNGQVSVALSHDPRTRSGQPGWSYSLFYAGDGQNPWVRSNWTAVKANTGYQQHWELAQGQWKRPVAGSVDVSVPPHYRNTQVWELRYELVGGRWSHEWIHLGACVPPPGA